MITIIIVEDQEEIRNGLAKIINEDIDLLLLSQFDNGEEAITNIEQTQPNVVIMDINLLGNLNGIDCVRKLSAICTNTQFMMFTIYESDEKIFEALEAGASGYILKKTSPEKIVESIKELHSGGSPMNFNIARKVINHFNKRSTTSSLLTDKQNEVLQLVAKGYLYKEIAIKLGITIGTVTQHIHKIYEKLHVSNKTEAINKVYGKA